MSQYNLNTKDLTPAEADMVGMFLDVAKALPRSFCLDCRDGKLIVLKRMQENGLKFAREVGTLKRKSLDVWK